VPLKAPDRLSKQSKTDVRKVSSNLSPCEKAHNKTAAGIDAVNADHSEFEGISEKERFQQYLQE
jgi:hypothetical protein